MTVLVASTGTDEGRVAVEQAVVEAGRRGQDLIIFHLDHSAVPEPSTDVPVRVLRPDAKDRDPVGALLDAAQREEVSLVVIGVRRRSAVGKLLLGSQAQQILLEAGASVLAVKPPPSSTY